MASDKSTNPLEQFVLLAKTAKGAAAIELINQALSSPGVYVYAELLDSPNIKELANGPEAGYYNLLNLFAYGTYSDYIANKSQLPELNASQTKKLRHLTIVSLATKNKCLPYSQLVTELSMKNLRELEDLIIEVIYADIVRGKLDQKHQQFEVDYAIGRDIRPEAIDEITNVLQDWCSGCETVLQGIECQITRANQHKETQNKLKLQIETEVTNIKKTLKSTQQDLDEHMVTDTRDHPSQTEKPSKKSSKTKGLRGSGGKLWGKSS